MGYKFFVNGTDEWGKSVKQGFYCREDAEDFAISCGWDDVEIVENGAEESLADKGVKAAVRYLKMRNYEIVEQGYKCPEGSFDIVALDDDVLVFVEVCIRTNGLPNINPSISKRARFERTAACFLADYPDKTDMCARFDNISMHVVSSDRAFLRHAINCFGDF